MWQVREAKAAKREAAALASAAPDMYASVGSVGDDSSSAASEAAQARWRRVSMGSLRDENLISPLGR